jgi:hypothetical protein
VILALLLKLAVSTVVLYLATFALVHQLPVWNTVVTLSRPSLKDVMMVRSDFEFYKTYPFFLKVT